MKTNTLALGITCLSAAFLLGAIGVRSNAREEREPIAYVGHGAFFDERGNEITPSVEFLRNAESWYERKLTGASNRSDGINSLYKSLVAGLELDGLEKIYARQAALTATVRRLAGTSVDSRTLGKLNAVEYRLRRILTAHAMKSLFFSSPETVHPELLRRVDNLSRVTIPQLLSTSNSGKEYVDECAASGVPIPPAIGQLDPAGRAGWKTQGFLPADKQFIVNTLAEVRTFESDQGVCYALPRYEDDTKATVGIDGVICLSKTTSRACFWDNQMKTKPYSFPAGTKIPIGYADDSINADHLYQAGGAELEGGSGGVCTDCHAGENPFIVHPRADLGSGKSWGSVEDGLPAFSPEKYIPLVAASWPQNDSTLDVAKAPGACVGCHSADGGAGRLPALSPALQGYCKQILPQALTRTMPLNKPGSQAANPQVQALLALCN